MRGKLKYTRKLNRIKNRINIGICIAEAIITLGLCTMCIREIVLLHNESNAQTEVESSAVINRVDDPDVYLTGAGIGLMCSDEFLEECIYVEEYTYIDETTDIELETATAMGMMWASTNLNVRAECSSESTWLGSYKKADRVNAVQSFSNGWTEVIYKGKQGYVCSQYLQEDSPIIKVSSTAYWDKYSRHSASMRELIKGKSIAGMVRWLNRSLNIYTCNTDGSVGELIGTFRCDDTGYGADSGVGQSKILKGRTIGTIENGTCIDMYMNTEDECYEYGRRNVYIQFLD